MKTGIRGMGGKVFKEKTQHRNLPHAKAETHDRASGARGRLSNSEQLASDN